MLPIHICMSKFDQNHKILSAKLHAQKNNNNMQSITHNTYGKAVLNHNTKNPDLL